MRKSIFRFLGLMLIAGAAIFTGCVKDDMETPPLNIPYVDFKANTTITQLNNMYAGTALDSITDDIIIKGIVIGNDLSGNIYKYIVIQDSTGSGIVVGLDRSSLYSDYRLGQRVFIKCKGMYIGSYNGLLQLGYTYNGSIGRLPVSLIQDHLFLDSLPGKVPTPVEISLTDNLLPKVSTLVKLTNVHFADAGLVWADEANSATSRDLMDASGNTIVVRTSKYADFHTKKIPYGAGTVIGILSIYNDDCQLTIRSISDVKDFNGVAHGTFDNPYNVSYAMANTHETAVWVQGYIVGVYETDVDPYAANFAAPYRTSSNILIANSADETSLSNCVPVQLPPGAIREALNLVSNGSNKGKQVKVLGDFVSYFGISGVKNLTGYWLDGSGIIPETGFFTEKFTTTLGQFTGYNVAGDQKWSWDTYDGGCAKMTGFANSAKNPNQDWLISSVINLSEHTGTVLNFSHAANFIGNHWDYLQVFISTDYDGSSNPSIQGTWTELTVPNKPTGSDWNFVDSGDIDLSAYDGQSNVHIAFKYTSTSSVAATWEIGSVIMK